MNAIVINDLLTKLRTNPRVPSFQALIIGADGGAQVIHRYGCVQFRSFDNLVAWVDGCERLQREQEVNPS